MSSLPHIPLNVADYLADTAHLTRAQHGSYLLLLMNYWQTEKPLNNEGDRLAIVAKMNPDEWLNEGSILAEFFLIKMDSSEG